MILFLNVLVALVVLHVAHSLPHDYSAKSRMEQLQRKMDQLKASLDQLEGSVVEKLHFGKMQEHADDDSNDIVRLVGDYDHELVDELETLEYDKEKLEKLVEELGPEDRKAIKNLALNQPEDNKASAQLFSSIFGIISTVSGIIHSTITVLNGINTKG